MHSQILHRFSFHLALILSVRPAFSLKKNGKLHIRCLWMLNDNLKLNDDKTEFLIIIWHTRTAGKGGHHEYLRG